MSKFVLKRKTYALGATLAKVAKPVGVGALGIGGLAGAAAYKAGGGDLISGGEKSAKEMEFS